MDQNKVTALLKNEDFAKKILAMDEPKDVQAAFKAEGVDITVEEVNAIGKVIEAKLSGKEISDEDLEGVAGGVVTAAAVSATIAIGALVINLADHIFGRNWMRRW